MTADQMCHGIAALRPYLRPAPIPQRRPKSKREAQQREVDRLLRLQRIREALLMLDHDAARYPNIVRDFAEAHAQRIAELYAGAS